MPELTHLRLNDVQGVGTIELNLEPNQQAYVFIGANGVGKTKLLEALVHFKDQWALLQSPPHEPAFNDDGGATFYPIVFIETRDRGHFIDGTGSNSGFLRDWICSSVNLSSNFRKNKKAHEHDLKDLLTCLNKMDASYDADFLELDDEDKIFLRVNGQEKELAELSTGFVSVIKILAHIISDYGQFNRDNSSTLNRTGFVLIDEIEGHLHLEWQVKIIPTLKQLFPNTKFFIATHSPLVLSQLEDGEAYELRRDADDVVRTHKINHPSSTAMIDLLKQAFHIDLNRLALERPVSNAQKQAKKKLLTYLRERKVS
ncbi:MAG: AAA family ATPase [Candidatus Thiothrix sulfatifontis]|nr:MAG: AAA family ATPase [Candidatus Thiothrix sulfatifontis]